MPICWLLNSAFSGSCNLDVKKSSSSSLIFDLTTDLFDDLGGHIDASIEEMENLSYWSGISKSPIDESTGGLINQTITLNIYDGNGDLYEGPISCVTDEYGKCSYDYSHISPGDYTYEANYTYGISQTGSLHIDGPTSDDTFSYIQSLINASASGSTLYLNATTYTNDINDNIIVNKAITIIGMEGTKLDAKHKSRIFNITSANVNIENITFVNGTAENGGAIYVNNDVSIKGSKFENNTAVAGNAIFLGSGNLFLENNIINTTRADIVILDGEIISEVNATVLLNRTWDTKDETYILNATLVDDNGNWINDSVFKFTVNDEIVEAAPEYNVSTGLYATEYTLTDERFYNVGISRYDNAYVHKGTIRNMKGTFSDLKNQIDAITDPSQPLKLPYDFKYATGIDDEFINGIPIDKNVTIQGEGHAICGSNLARVFNVTDTTQQFVLTDMTICDAKADNGSALYAYRTSLEISDVTFANNTATDSGGAIYTKETLFIINNTLFDNNTAKNANAIYAGDIIDTFLNPPMIIRNSNFINNGKDNDYAIYNDGLLTLKNNTVSNIIYNNKGLIPSEITATLNNNQTIYDKARGDKVTLNATLTDDNGNSIYDPYFRIAIDDDSIPEIDYDTTTRLYNTTYTIEHTGETIVSTHYDNANITVYIGIYSVPKSNATLTLSTNQNKFKDGDNVTVFVELYDKKTGEGLNESIKVIINNTEIPVDIINGSGSYNVSGLAPNQYAALATFEGNTDYNGPVYDNTVFTVLYPDRTLSIETDDIKYGEVAVVNITVEDAEGNEVSGTVVLNIDGENYTEIVNGKKSLKISGLTINETGYLINATLLEDNFNTEVVNDTILIKVSKNTLTIDSEVISVDPEYGDDVDVKVSVETLFNHEEVEATVTVYNTTGEVYEEFTLALGKKNIITFYGYDAGTYTYNITSSDADERYESATYKGQFTIAPSNIYITLIGYNEENEYGSEFKAIIELEDYIGHNVGAENVSITIKDDINTTVYSDTIDIEDATEISVPIDFASGNYTLEVNIPEQKNYNKADATLEFLVYRASSRVHIYRPDTVNYPDDIVIEYDVINKTTLTVSVKDADKNNITEGIVVNDDNISISGLKAGEYTILIENADNDYYSGSLAALRFSVAKSNNANITAVPNTPVYGENAIITVTAADGTTPLAGNATVKVDTIPVKGIFYITENGTAIDLGKLSSGTHTVSITFGNDNYENVTQDIALTVGKATPVVSVDDVNATYGNDVAISVSVTGVDGETINGDVIISIGDKDYIVKDGQVTIPAGLIPDEYTIVAKFGGNDNYKEATDTAILNVSKSTLTIDSEVISVDPEYGDDVDVKVSVETLFNHEEVEATVTVYNTTGEVYEEFTLALGKKNIITFYNYDAGTYTYNITSSDADDRYESATYEGQFTIAHSNIYITLIGYNEENEYGSEFKAIIELEDYIGHNVGAENVSISIKDNNDTIVYSDTIDIEGIKEISVPIDFASGNYTLEVNTPEQKNYNKTEETYEFKVYRASSRVHIYRPDTVNYPDDIVIEYDVINKTTLTVSVKDADKNNITEGIVVNDDNISISGLKAGEYTILIENIGNEYYSGSLAALRFTIAKGDVAIIPEVTGDLVYGDEANVTFTLPEDTDSDVTVTLDGEDVIAEEVGDGNYVVEFDSLTAGTHIVTVKLTDDSNYNDATGFVTFEVSKADPETAIEVHDVVAGNDVTIIVSVPEDVTGYVLFDVDGENYYADIEDSEAVLVLSDLPADTYTVKYTYPGDSNYNEASDEDDFEVSFNDTYEIKAETGASLVGYDANVDVILPEDATGDVIVSVNGENYTVPVINGRSTVTVPDLPAGDFTAEVYYPGDDKYAPSSTSAVIQVDKIANANITAEAEPIEVGEDAIVEVYLPDDAAGNVTVTVDGENYTAPVEDGAAFIIVPDLAAGNYTADVVYSGDEKYKPVSTTVDIEVDKVADAEIDVSSGSAEVGENATVVVKLPEDATGEVTVTVDGKNYTAPVEDGVAVVEIPGLPAGEYEAEVTYPGDDKYEPVSTAVEIDVEKVPDAEIDISSKPAEVGEDAVVEVTLPEDATGEVTVTVDGKNYTAPVKNGKASVTVSDLPAGTYPVDVVYSGDDKYDPVSTKGLVTVDKVSDANITAEADPVEPGKDAVIEVTLPEDATGVVVADIDGELFAANVENGTATITIPGLNAGNYTTEVTYYGDDKYDKVTTTVDIEVEGEIEVTAPDVVKYYSGPERFYVYILENGQGIANKSVSITLNGATYNRTTDKNGTASIGLNLNSGNYTVQVKVDDVELNASVTVKPTIIASDITKMFRNATQYYATFYDSEGKLLTNTNVTFNINGVFYSRVTNDKGVARLNINLEPNEYIITAYNPVSGEQCSNNITVLSTIISKDLTKYYRNASQFAVTILGEDGNPVGAGVAVKFNINGVFYERTTNESGIAKININLQPGEYTITTEYNGCMVSNNITVLPVLSAEDLTKKYGTKDQFVATLVDGQGKPYAGQSVTFNVNGVFYNRSTDSSGQAKLNINLMTGKYIITSTYNGASVSNTITVTA